MDKEVVKKYEGKKVLIFLKNNFQYTTILPKNIDSNFKIIDKYGEEVWVDCNFITFIKEVKE